MEDPKTWAFFKNEFGLAQNLLFKYIQLVNSIPIDWKNKISAEPDFRIDEMSYHSQGILVCTRLVKVNMLVSKQLYDTMLRKRNHTPTAQVTLKAKYANLVAMKWSHIYHLPRKTTMDPFLRNFQYKILNNILYLNQRLYTFGKSLSKMCSYCGILDENVEHIFYECPHSIRLWDEVVTFFSPVLIVPALSPQSALIGFHSEVSDHNLLLNHLLLLFKVFIYKNREQKRLVFNNLQTIIKNVFKLEIQCQKNLRSDRYYSEKWNIVRDLLET